MRSCARCILTLVLLVAAAATADAQRSTVAQLFADTKLREAAIRAELDAGSADKEGGTLVARARTVVKTYEDIARLFPVSPYSDDALWRGGMLAADAYWQFGDALDRTRALQLLNALTARFPTSSLVKQVGPQAARLTAAEAPASSTQPPLLVSTTTAVPVRRAIDAPAPVALRSVPAARATASVLTAIRREILPEVLRVTLELERETTFDDERIEGPSRVFIDLQNTASKGPLNGVTLSYSDDVVRQIRVGRQLGGRTRVVLDLSGATRHSVYTLYNPYRVVVEFERPSTLAGGRAQPPARHTAVPGRTVAAGPPLLPASHLAESTLATAVPLMVRSASASGAAPLPRVKAVASIPARAAAGPLRTPAPNANGTLSLSRQLGLGVTKIVIDPGHGGHDPGAQITGLEEADFTLDVALRLEKLLLDQAGAEVVLTRRTDTYVSLEERTALANRESADLFLSIHANASDDARARGIETYFLSFALNPQAEAIAARENAGSARTMRSLPEIVRAITLNDKINESRDFAGIVQTSLLERLKKANRVPRNLGVKQAPFMVLIGATMPSVLVELSFLTHQQESSWLKTSSYRQQLAEALLAGIVRYQRSLKGTQVAAQ